MAGTSTKKQPSMDAKAMIDYNNEQKTKFHRRDRMAIEATVTTYNKRGEVRLQKGKVYRPHRLHAEQMIKDGLAKKYVEEN